MQTCKLKIARIHKIVVCRLSGFSFPQAIGTPRTHMMGRTSGSFTCEVHWLAGCWK